MDLVAQGQIFIQSYFGCASEGIGQEDFIGRFKVFEVDNYFTGF
jgi:hypothetical protein